jgi:hypothetical protein
MDNLPLLRDIHLPPEETGFPLGYGWFLLLALLIVFGLAFYVGRRLYRQSRKRYALRLLQNSSADTPDDVVRISALLRRVCRYKYHSAVSLYGREWLAFLLEHSKKRLSDSAAGLLLNAPYMPPSAVFAHADYEDVRRFARHWIGENL